MKTMKYLFVALAAMLCLGACQKKFQENWPELKLDRASLVISAVKERTPVNIFYNGSWTAELTKGDWLTVEPASGTGMATIHLCFGENTGLSRAAELIVRADNGMERVLPITQSSAVALPQIIAEKSAVKCTDSGQAKEVVVLTNLPYTAFSKIIPEIAYEESGQSGWISSIRFLEKEEPLNEEQRAVIPDGVKRFVAVDVVQNTSGADRSAMLKFALTDAAETEYSCSIRFTQTAQGPYINLPASNVWSKEGGRKRVPIDTNQDESLFSLTVSYPDPASGEFISSAVIKNGCVDYTVSENVSGAERVAQIKLSYQELESTMTISQTTTEMSFADYTIDGPDAFEMWANHQEKWASTDNIKLGADIDLSGMNWTPANFEGTFDGQNHTISGLNVESDRNSGFVDTLSGTLRNLKLAESCSFKSSAQASSAVGVVCVAWGNALIDNIVTSAAITCSTGSSQTLLVGGILGRCSSATVTVQNCTNKGNIINSAASSTFCTGGIIGYDASDGLAVVNCTNNGDITNKAKVTYGRIGGIAGRLGSGTGEGTLNKLEDCNNNGNILISGASSSDLLAGGVVGMISTKKANGTRLTRCNNAGSVVVSGNGKVGRIGGIVGDFGSGGTMTSCKNSGAVNISASSFSSELRISAMVGSNTNQPLSMSDCESVGVIVSNAANTPTLYISTALSYNTQNGDSISGCKCAAQLINTGEVTKVYAMAVMAYIKGKVSNCQVGGTVLGTALTADNFNEYIAHASATVSSCTFLPNN